MATSARHDAWRDYLQFCPDEVGRLLSGLLDRGELPSFSSVRLDSPDLSQCINVETRADAVAVLLDDAGEPIHAILGEVQCGRDDDKQYAWPMYAAVLRHRLRCGVTLVVFCPERSLLRWCSRPIVMGHPDWVLKPVVIGPDQIPVITDVAEAIENPRMALLSAMAHSRDPSGDKVIRAFLEVLQNVKETEAEMYTDMVAAADDGWRERLAEIRSWGYEFKSSWALDQRAEGKAEGKAEAIVEFLRARGFDVPEHIQHRVMECTDLDRLDALLTRAATTPTLDALFD